MFCQGHAKLMTAMIIRRLMDNDASYRCVNRENDPGNNTNNDIAQSALFVEQKQILYTLLIYTTTVRKSFLPRRLY